ncbi:TonB-dependent hemoglobin/transferrin/lactoferrin family receptor [Enterovirga rhinocerotis]|uniref:Hemoglobin/transferrin/lactoferrin receptor protein n=1 Tax=Enterovirga rhinocerotis TaxID=1339210 RepID=A0A4V6PZN2_9HYPH|nr:TonB-dependent hemoglobin/transferrin/lactoferrin family receptor [Enterovirga rhinocerotis]TDR94059.1 hemoglobin/transferrin/lactoferrin receptor protein [Enterovirga rhinocerotis]
MMNGLLRALYCGTAVGAVLVAAPGSALAQAPGGVLPPVTVDAPHQARPRAAASRQAAGGAGPRQRARDVRRAAPRPAAAAVVPVVPTTPAPTPAFLPGSSGRPAGSPLLQGPTTTTTTRAELDQLQIQSIQDLGRSVEAGISFNRNNNSINIRGLDGPRVLTTIDGIRQSFITDTRVGSSATNAFDFDSLSSLDLVRGPGGASLVGPGTLGGALAVRTLDPRNLIQGNNTYGGMAKTGYDSMDRAWFGSAAGAARLGQTYFMLQGNVRDGEETENHGRVATIGSTRTKPNPASFTQYGILGKIHHYVDEVHRFGITGEVFRRGDRIQTRTSTVSAAGNYRPGFHSSGEDVARDRISLTYDYKDAGGWLDEASANLYWQRVKRNSLVNAYRFTSVRGPFGRDNEYEENAFGFIGHVAKSMTTGMFSHRLLAGTELRTTSLTQYSTGVDSCSFAFSPACNNLHTNQADMPKVEGQMVGLYVQDEIGVFDNRLRVTPGVRFDWYEERPQNTPSYTNGGSHPVGLPPSSSDSAWSPRVRVEYDVVRDTPWLGTVTAFAQWSKGFRAPTANELYSRFGAVGTYLRTGNADLRPEKSDGIDVGVRFGDARFGGSMTYFHTNYKNFIETIQTAPPGGLYPQGGISSYRNIARAEIHGFEANAHYFFLENWRVRGSFSYVRGINKDDDTFINSIPPMQGIIGLAYDTGVWGTEVSTKIAAKRDDVASLTGGTAGFVAPGYTIWNVTAWWQPTQLPNVQFYAGVYNVFDRKYFDAVTVPVGTLSQPRDYYSEPGRTAKVTMKYQF